MAAPVERLPCRFALAVLFGLLSVAAPASGLPASPALLGEEDVRDGGAALAVAVVRTADRHPDAQPDSPPPPAGHPRPRSVTPCPAARPMALLISRSSPLRC